MLLTAGAAVLVSGGVMLNGCKKDTSTQTTQNREVDPSEAMVAHILEFKDRMAYYRENPNLKTGGQLYTAPEAVIELESLLNFNFCYTDIQCNQKKFVTSEVIMPLDELEKINDPKLMEVYYDRTIDTIQAQMARVNYPNMKLLLVDLEVSGMDSNGDAIVSVGALIGNEFSVARHDDGWWYGEQNGLCADGGQAPEDGASQLCDRVTNAVVPAPPAGGRWIYSSPILPNYIYPTQDTLTGDIDNYLDYKIFYATSFEGDLEDSVYCMSRYEMDFYEGHYINYAITTEDTTGLDFDHCIIGGNPYTIEGYDIIQHDYTIFVGHRNLVMDLTIEDILAY